MALLRLLSNLMNKKFFSQEVIDQILDTKKVLLLFLRHPVKEVKKLPNWPWPRLIFLQISVTAFAGLAAGIIDKKMFFSIVAGLITMPILTFISLMISTLFFYYCFQVFASTTLSLRRLFTLLLFANIPYFIFQILSGLVPPITLVGLAFTGFLLIVGFVENFYLNKKLVIRIVAALYAVIFCMWMWEKITSTQWDKSWRSETYQAPPVELGN